MGLILVVKMNGLRKYNKVNKLIKNVYVSKITYINYQELSSFMATSKLPPIIKIIYIYKYIYI
jgi:hypothetical protein